MIFRSATIEDFDKLVPLVDSFYQFLAEEKKQPPDSMKEQNRTRKYLKKYLMEPNCVYMICERDNQILAYSFLSVEKNKKGIAYINELFVAYSERGKKIGLSLLEKSLKWFATKNCRQINLTVNRYNTSANKLYKQLGFQTKYEDYVDMTLKP